MKKSFFPVALRFLGLAFLLAAHLSAQQLATLNVTVTDPSGSLISQARVTLRNVETSAKRTDLSSGTGVAVIPGLPAGSYQLTVESDQFSSYQAPLTLTVGQYASVAVYGAPAFLGPIPQKFGDGISSPANPTFGSPNFVAPARQIQLAMRLNF